jgi:hypothetical protein
LTLNAQQKRGQGFSPFLFFTHIMRKAWRSEYS